jgi:hypothetical protein
MDEGSKRARNALIGLVAVAAVVITGAWVLTPSSRAPGGLPAQVSNTLPPAGSNLAGEAPVLVVPDQYPGAIVFVSQVKLKDGGWVVIYDDAGGRPGRVIGAGYFDKNATIGDINLSTLTEEGRTYYAMLQADNGDVNFNPALDLPLKDASGASLVVSFLVTRDLPVSKG